MHTRLSPASSSKVPVGQANKKVSSIIIIITTTTIIHTFITLGLHMHTHMRLHTQYITQRRVRGIRCHINTAPPAEQRSKVPTKASDVKWMSVVCVCV
jgi:hypothetical protein